MAEMTDEQWKAFISVGTRTGKLGVIRKDGRPMVVPVWFVLSDDGVIRFQTSTSSAKGKAIARDPRICLTIDDETPPYSFVAIDALATIRTDDDELTRRIAFECVARYMGADRGQEFADRNAVPGECTIELEVTRVIAHLDVSA